MTHLRSEHKDAWETVSWTTIVKRKLFIKSYILVLGFGEKGQIKENGY